MEHRKSSWCMRVILVLILLLIVDYTILDGRYIAQPVKYGLHKVGIIEKSPMEKAKDEIIKNLSKENLEKATKQGKKILDEVLKN